MNLSRIALGFAVVALLSGCDLFSKEDTRILLSGTVVLAETGEPLPGLGVTLRSTGGFGSSVFIQAKTQTGADGAFRLDVDAEEGAAFSFNLNDDPYDGRYTAFGEPVRAGKQTDYGVIELRRATTP